jgi:hypothetical protein
MMGPSRSRAARSRTARRGCAQRESRVRAPLDGMLCGAAPADGRRARCMLRRVVYGVRHSCMMHRRALHVIYTSLLCIGARCMMRRRALHVVYTSLLCIGACCTLHWRRTAVPQRLCCVVRCWCVARALLDRAKGGAVAVAERRRDALVRSATAACSPWTRAPRCSTPWRYPAPKHRRVRG